MKKQKWKDSRKAPKGRDPAIAARDGTPVRIRDDTEMHTRDDTKEVVSIRDDKAFFTRDGTKPRIRDGTCYKKQSRSKTGAGEVCLVVSNIGAVVKNDLTTEIHIGPRMPKGRDPAKRIRDDTPVRIRDDTALSARDGTKPRIRDGTCYKKQDRSKTSMEEVCLVVSNIGAVVKNDLTTEIHIGRRMPKGRDPAKRIRDGTVVHIRDDKVLRTRDGTPVRIRDDTAIFVANTVVHIRGRTEHFARNGTKPGIRDGTCTKKQGRNITGMGEVCPDGKD